METFKVGIIDDDHSKVTQLMIRFEDRNQNCEDSYKQYKLQPIEINASRSQEEIIHKIIAEKIDAMIIDYDLSSFSTSTNNGIKISKNILANFIEYPIFVITAYEDRLFKNEIFNAYQIFDFDKYLNDNNTANFVHSRLIEQILKLKRQKKEWEEELLALQIQAGKSVEVDSRILELDNLIEKSIDGKSSLPPKLREELSSNKLEELIEKVDKVLERD